MTARILIVEDEEPLTTLLRYNLEAEGYDVESATRGDDADLRIKESVPDLAVINWSRASPASSSSAGCAPVQRRTTCRSSC